VATGVDYGVDLRQAAKVDRRKAIDLANAPIPEFGL
jgi:uncharacterized protein YdaT